MEPNVFKVEINVDYYEGLEKRFLLIKTNENKKTVSKNIERAEFVINTAIWNEYESYEEYYKEYSEMSHSILTKEEFEIMKSCFDGYNEDTFENYLKEKCGYDVKAINKACDFEVNIF